MTWSTVCLCVLNQIKSHGAGVKHFAKITEKKMMNWIYTLYNHFSDGEIQVGFGMNFVKGT